MHKWNENKNSYKYKLSSVCVWVSVLLSWMLTRVFDSMWQFEWWNWNNNMYKILSKCELDFWRSMLNELRRLTKSGRELFIFILISLKITHLFCVSMSLSTTTTIFVSLIIPTDFIFTLDFKKYSMGVAFHAYRFQDNFHKDFLVTLPDGFVCLAVTSK